MQESNIFGQISNQFKNSERLFLAQFLESDMIDAQIFKDREFRTNFLMS